jgi:hypothetical protein
LANLYEFKVSNVGSPAFTAIGNLQTTPWRLSSVNKPRRKYAGALNTPIKLGRFGTGSTEQQEKVKLKLLFGHYGVLDGDFKSLSLAMARDLVPGFRVKEVTYHLSHGSWGAVVPVKGSGRRRVWDGDRLGDLYAEVLEIKDRTSSLTDREALMRLVRQPNWKPPANHRGTSSQWIETLEARLQEAKRIEKRADKLWEAALSATETVRANSGN